MSTPSIRITSLNDHDANTDGEFVLYWMIAQRRTVYNFALDRAIELAKDLKKPLVIFEPLRVGYAFASERLHRFIIDGMVDQRAATAKAPVTYYPYVERKEGEGQGLLKALSERACVIVTDDYPCFFIPNMVDAAAQQVGVAMEMVDSNGMLPLRAAEKTYTTAYSFRRGLHKMLPAHLTTSPNPTPLSDLDLPRCNPEHLSTIQSTWPVADDDMLQHGATTPLQTIEFACEVTAAALTGGQRAGIEQLQAFLDERIDVYHERRNDIAQDAASGLSPYLHFGHVGAHQVFDAVMTREGWSIDKLPEKATGKREGWWQVTSGSEMFLDEFITWREIGLNMCHREPHRYDEYDSLPEFAKATLKEHIDDERDYLYDRDTFERGNTHDELWNAAQNQLVTTGQMHNYIRMLWGKKIIEWTPTPQDALEIMLYLNNKYALDGRDPNSYSGIFWCLGRYDRGWTEREVFGKIRFMSSASTRRKFKVGPYIEKYASGQASLL